MSNLRHDANFLANDLDNCWLPDQIMQAFHSHLLTSKFALHNKAPGSCTKKFLHVEGDFVTWDFPEVTLVGLLRLELLRVPLDLSIECQYLLLEVVIFSLYESAQLNRNHHQWEGEGRMWRSKGGGRGGGGGGGGEGGKGEGWWKGGRGGESGKGEGGGREEGGGNGKGGRRYCSPYTATLYKNLPVSLVATDHSIFPNQQFFSRKPRSDFSPFAPPPPFCHTWPSTLQLWTSIPRTPAQSAQPEHRANSTSHTMTS